MIRWSLPADAVELHLVPLHMHAKRSATHEPNSSRKYTFALLLAAALMAACFVSLSAPSGSAFTMTSTPANASSNVFSASPAPPNLISSAPLDASSCALGEEGSRVRTRTREKEERKSVRNALLMFWPARGRREGQPWDILVSLCSVLTEEAGSAEDRYAERHLATIDWAG